MGSTTDAAVFPGAVARMRDANGTAAACRCGAGSSLLICTGEGPVHTAAPELSDFFTALRGGCPQAAEEMETRLRPFLLRVIHLRLLAGRLSHIVDTGDIYQSLLKDFLARPDSSLPTSRRPGNLYAYLMGAVHHKIQMRTRRESRQVASLPTG